MDGKGKLRTYFLLLVVTVVPLFSLGLANHGVWTADEPRVAEIGREMALSGNVAVPTLDGRPFLEEPPLYYASVAAVFRAFGVSDRVVRVPSAVFAAGGVFALFFLGSMLFGPRAGFASAFVMATCGEYFRVAHWVIVDSALAFFVIAGLAFFAAAYFKAKGGKALLFYTLCYVSCTFAFYAKGFIGIAIPGLAVLAFLAVQRDGKGLLRMYVPLGVAVFAALTVPWFLSLYAQGGAEPLRVFFIHNHLDRFAGGQTGHHQPFYYYLTQFPGGFLPWSLLLLPALVEGFRGAASDDEGQSAALRFCLAWFFAGFIFLSAASTKRVLYLMPVFAPVSLLTGRYIERTLSAAFRPRLYRLFEVLFAAVPLAAGLILVPSCLYLSKRYGAAIGLSDWASVGLFSLAAVALSVCALASRKKIGRFWVLSSASVAALLVFCLVTVVPLLDAYKSFVPFCRDIEATVPAASALYGFDADETLRGAVPFYTGRLLTEVRTVSALEDAARKERIFVVVRDSRGALEKELMSTGRFSVLSRRGMDPKRSLVLFASNGPACPLAVGAAGAVE